VVAISEQDANSLLRKWHEENAPVFVAYAAQLKQRVLAGSLHRTAIKWVADGTICFAGSGATLLLSCENAAFGYVERRDLPPDSAWPQAEKYESCIRAVTTAGWDIWICELNGQA